ncbi:MAG: ATP-grasp domain-containing protein [Niameybacter sp.]
MKGLLIYKREDYEKNISYAKMLVDYGKEEGLEIQCVCFEDMQMGMDQAGLWVMVEEERVQAIAFVINRTRESILGKQFEQMGIRVFNSSEVTYIANHKGYTHQFASGLGMKALQTMMFYPRFMDTTSVPFDYPFVVKSPEGHGGNEVFKVENRLQFEELLGCCDKEEWLIQELCKHVGEDVRVFVIGNEIVGAIRRYSKVDFRANYCLGGQIESYTLKVEQEELVRNLLRHLKCDYVGVDFIIDEKGEFIFNELEDAVGSRSFSTLQKVDTAKLYILHIAKALQMS